MSNVTVYVVVRTMYESGKREHEVRKNDLAKFFDMAHAEAYVTSRHKDARFVYGIDVRTETEEEQHPLHKYDPKRPGGQQHAAWAHQVQTMPAPKGKN